jgi:Transcription factor WhiB
MHELSPPSLQSDWRHVHQVPDPVVIADNPSLRDRLSAITKPPEWMEDAACEGADAVAFFTPPYESVIETFCVGCPVRARCGEYARENKLYGVWGGVNHKGGAPMTGGEN